ncbi:MAG: hypothetical protein NC117_10005 [Pseudoflavonifractor sp.]|nr:hypothetical protein [Pseudoflavonifractor sp.]
MELSAIANLILGGGLIATVVSIVTLRSSIAKVKAEAEQAKAEADKARADADTVKITNAESATRILVENIVKPLKEELNATREDLTSTKREMASTKREMGRLRKAVEAATRCPHSDNCPVIIKLSRDKPGDSEQPGVNVTGDNERGIRRCRSDPAGVAP